MNAAANASKKILIADDDSSIRLVLSQAFTRLGYQVRATGNASTLLKWAEEGEGGLETPAGFEKWAGFMGDERVGAGEVGGDLVGAVVGVDDDALGSGAGDGERVVQQREARDGDQRFRAVGGERAHAGAKACGEDHGGLGRHVRARVKVGARRASVGWARSERICARTRGRKAR